MTDNDIIKALKECLTEPCSEQAYINAVRNALDLINRLKSKNEALRMDKEQLESDVINANMNCEHLQAEIEELESEIDKQYQQAEADILGNLPQGGASCHWCIDKHKAYAIKEVFEKLRAECTERFLVSGDTVIEILNEIEREMLGENNG